VSESPSPNRHKGFGDNPGHSCRGRRPAPPSRLLLQPVFRVGLRTVYRDSLVYRVSLRAIFRALSRSGEVAKNPVAFVAGSDTVPDGTYQEHFSNEPCDGGKSCSDM
jgi:hypothetical protein